MCAGCIKDSHSVPLEITFIASLNFMVSLSHCFRAPGRLAEVLPDLRSNSVFLSVQLCFLLQIFIPFMALYYSTVCVYHILFIHSSVDRHVGYFHVLAIVTSAMNVRMHVSF